MPRKFFHYQKSSQGEVPEGKPVHTAALSFTAALLLSTALAGIPRIAFAQNADTPSSQSGVSLPQVEVLSDQQAPAKPAKPKTAKAKAGKKGTAPPVATTAVGEGIDDPVVGGPGEPTGTGTTKAGLNLNAPADTASRLSMTPLETPASVEVISGDTIRQRGQTSVVDAVTQNAAGFTSTAAPGNGGTSLAARGFTGHGSVMQLFDGTRLYIASGTVTFPFNTWSAERVEVLRGPASVMYGEGAIGGVINVIPKKPTDYFTNEAEIAVGTDGMKRFGVGSGGPVSPNLAYRIDASGLTSDGWHDQNGDFDNLSLSGAVRYRVTPDLSVTLSHDYGKQNPLRYFGTPLIDGQIKSNLRSTNFNVDDSDVSYRDNWTQLKTEWTPSDSITVRNTAYRLTSHRHWRNVESYSYNDVTGRVDRDDFIEIYHDQEQIGNRFDTAFRTAFAGMRNELVVGFDVNKIKFRHTNNSPYATDPSLDHSVDPFNFVPGLFDHTSPTILGFDSEISQYALFAEDRLEVTKQLSFVAGIRLDRPSMERTTLVPGPNYGRHFDKDFSDVTWRAGVVYEPIRDLALYASYTTGVDPIGGAVLTMSEANSAFELATGRQIEVGMKQSFWGGRGEWTVALYDIVKNNLTARDPDNPTRTIQVGQQSSRGIEGSLALQLTDTVRYEGNVAILEAQYDDFVQSVGGVAVNYAGNRPVNVPEQVVNNWLSWAFLPDWEARVGVRWVGDVYANINNTVKRPDYTVVNLGLDYAPTEWSRISARVFNVFDEVYATGGGTGSWTLAPPRTAEISYRVKF